MDLRPNRHQGAEGFYNEESFTPGMKVLAHVQSDKESMELQVPVKVVIDEVLSDQGQVRVEVCSTEQKEVIAVTQIIATPKPIIVREENIMEIMDSKISGFITRYFVMGKLVSDLEDRPSLGELFKCFPRSICPCLYTKVSTGLNLRFRFGAIEMKFTQNATKNIVDIVGGARELRKYSKETSVIVCDIRNSKILGKYKIVSVEKIVQFKEHEMYGGKPKFLSFEKFMKYRENTYNSFLNPTVRFSDRIFFEPEQKLLVITHKKLYLGSIVKTHSNFVCVRRDQGEDICDQWYDKFEADHLLLPISHELMRFPNMTMIVHDVRGERKDGDASKSVGLFTPKNEPVTVRIGWFKWNDYLEGRNWSLANPLAWGSMNQLKPSFPELKGKTTLTEALFANGDELTFRVACQNRGKRFNIDLKRPTYRLAGWLVQCEYFIFLIRVARLDRYNSKFPIEWSGSEPVEITTNPSKKVRKVTSSHNKFKITKKDNELKWDVVCSNTRECCMTMEYDRNEKKILLFDRSREKAWVKMLWVFVCVIDILVDAQHPNYIWKVGSLEKKKKKKKKKKKSDLVEEDNEEENYNHERYLDEISSISSDDSEEEEESSIDEIYGTTSMYLQQSIRRESGSTIVEIPLNRPMDEELDPISFSKKFDQSPCMTSKYMTSINSN